MILDIQVGDKFTYKATVGVYSYSRRVTKFSNDDIKELIENDFNKGLYRTISRRSPRVYLKHNEYIEIHKFSKYNDIVILKSGNRYYIRTYGALIIDLDRENFIFDYKNRRLNNLKYLLD